MTHWLAASLARMEDAEKRQWAMQAYTRAVNLAHRDMMREIQSRQSETQMDTRI